ncbi:hypothetical protein LRS06_15340 [Hymenobacter sp. J193]|uniref:hypothetical protein n=1 Tax=Hymenobacter sp. J193 TaxID=2898429 RepID=UPI002151875F|nr:hypothetical protein [Hymenobacter sp. J193]MCR5889111.1 hypothetical protein [Hymenobacter sp. J193]
MGLRWLVLFLGTTVLAVPFFYWLLPNWGLGHLAMPLLNRIAQAVLQPPATGLTLHSDTLGLYLMVGGLAVASAVAALIWTLRAGQRTDSAASLWYYLHTGAAWFLALHLLIYGFDKVFKHQFYLPEPNTLYTPLGFLTPDIAYWSLLGAVRPYTIFLGLLEVAAALLLLWGRLRLVGGVVALAVLAQVVALNFGLDISVKVWSSFLLLLACIVAGPALRMGYAALVERRWRPAFPQRPAQWQGRWVGGLRGLGLGVLLVEATGGFVQTASFNDDRQKRPLLHGAYVVARQATTSATTLPRRVFVHRRGYFILQFEDEQLYDFRLAYLAGQRLLLRDHEDQLDTLEFRVAGNTVYFQGYLQGKRVVWRTQRLPWRQLPLLQASPHWTTESYRQDR